MFLWTSLKCVPVDFIESTLDSDQRVSLMHRDLSDAAKGIQHKIMSAGRLRALMHLTNPERVRGGLQSELTVTKVSNKSNDFTFLQFYDVAHPPQELLNEVHHGLRIP